MDVCKRDTYAPGDKVRVASFTGMGLLISQYPAVVTGNTRMMRGRLQAEVLVYDDYLAWWDVRDIYPAVGE